MRDLEIRGAGNLLGANQSGHIAAVGYDLYVQMVSEAVAELKGEPVREPAEIKLDLPVDAHLPKDYVRQGGPAARGLPPAGGGHDRGRGRRHPRRVARPLRPRPAAGRGAARRGPSAGRVRPSRHPRGHRRQARRVDAARRPCAADQPARAEDEPGDAPQAPRPEGGLQGRARPGGGARCQRKVDPVEAARAFLAAVLPADDRRGDGPE